jgi:hypothetical protein
LWKYLVLEASSKLYNQNLVLTFSLPKCSKDFPKLVWLEKKFRYELQIFFLKKIEANLSLSIRP